MTRKSPFSLKCGYFSSPFEKFSTFSVRFCHNCSFETFQPMFDFCVWIQNIWDMCILDEFWNDTQPPIKFKKSGVGSGHCYSGTRREYTQRNYFEQDLLEKELLELGPTQFASKHGGFTKTDILYIWSKIRDDVMRPLETEVHGRNKILVWMDKLHNKLTWKQISRNYHISESNAIIFMDDLTEGIIEAYKDSNIISFPSKEEQQEMNKLLAMANKPMPNCSLNLDGKHARCKGLRKFERLSAKFNFHQACFNVLFVTERVFGTVCCLTLDKSAHKADIRVLRESTWFQELEQLTHGGIIMADKGYVGIESSCIAAQQKKGMKMRSKFPSSFWSEMSKARSTCERVFSHIFVNKWPQLSMFFASEDKLFHDYIVLLCLQMIGTVLDPMHSKNG